MSKTYEERFLTPIGEIFKDDKELMKKLYDCMSQENMSYERDELFTELLSTMKKMQEEINTLKELTKKQQEKQAELEGKTLNTLVVEQAKDVASSTKAEYEAAKEAFITTKEKILSTIKDTIAQYYRKGKGCLLQGASTLLEGMRIRNSKRLKDINVRVRKRNEKLERLDAIEKELFKTKAQVGNLFRTIVGREKRYDRESSSHLLNLVKGDLNLLNDMDLKSAEHLLLSNKKMERLKEKMNGTTFHSEKRKASLNAQVRSAKREQQKNQNVQKQVSYKKTERGNLRSEGRV